MTSGLLTRAAAVLFAAIALSLATPSLAKAEPAMWVIKDADSTIYLFGSVHILKPDLAWETARMKAALASASEVWFEIPNPSEQEKLVGEILPTLLQKGLSLDKPLSSRLSAAEFVKVSDKAKAFGIDVNSLNLMRPWLAAVILSTAPMQKQGYAAQSGVEVTLEVQARDAGETIKNFETVQQQLAFFADLSDDVQLAYLKSVLDDRDDGGKGVDNLIAAWAKGDLRALEKGAVDEARAESPALYDALIVQRNTNWADQIIERLKGSGVSFIAVGAGHLVGPDSLQAQLKKKGVVAKRY